MENEKLKELENQLIKAIESDDFLEVKKLVQQGADVNAKHIDEPFGYPLCLAAAYSKIEIAFYLLKEGADPNVMNGHALISAMYADGYLLEEMLKCGGNPKDHRIIKKAIEKNDLKRIELLLNYGADIEEMLTIAKKENKIELVQYVIKNMQAKELSSKLEESLEQKTNSHDKLKI